MTVCQENCIFSDYDYDIQKAKCSCDVEESSDYFDDININTTELLNNFIDIEKNSNIKILNCYKILFSGGGFIKNTGSYILIVVLFNHFIILILFYIKKSYTINPFYFSIKILFHKCCDYTSRNLGGLK